LRVKRYSRATLEFQRLQNQIKGAGDGPYPPFVPLGEHLVAIPASDWPESTQTVSDDHLAGWGVTVFEALKVGKANLAETMKVCSKIGDHLISFISGDNYDAPRVLLVDLIRGMGLAGRLVAMVPDRDSALIAQEDDETALAMMLDLVEDKFNGPYGLSGFPLVLDGDEWADWSPPSGHPLEDRFRDLEQKYLGSLYSQQTELLRTLYEKQGVDIFVANFSGIQKDDGTVATYCVWGNGVDCLLPFTQKVVLMREHGEGPTAIGDFGRVRSITGSMLVPTDHYPPRFRVREFPDDAALAAIGKEDL
jgi:hypothetical protein